MKKYVLILLCVLFFSEIGAQLTPLRTEISLNGKWNFTPEGDKQTQITVPDYWDAIPEFKGIKEAVYEKEVSIPDTPKWQNKTLKLDFEGVNFIATVFINNEEVGSHIGGWIPFTMDITDYVKPGESFLLKVKVKGGSSEPVVDKEGIPLWPVGLNGQSNQWGIMFDVWLRAYGKIHTEDAFIQTSYRKKKIKIDYTITNSGKKEQNFSIRGVVTPETDQQISLSMNSGTYTLQAGETKVISLEKEWSDPNLWSPANPFLYHLETLLVDESENILDSETRRFGFREIWTEGNKLMFNGHPFTILGTNIVQYSEYFGDQRYQFMMPWNWNSTIDRLFDLNFNTVRFHMSPVPRYILNMADERGLLVIDESGIYAREYTRKIKKEEYLKNSKRWIEPWVKSHRNHPSVIIWNAENEMGVGWLKWMTSEEMKSLGDEIRKFDTTRPVNYDGDQDVGDAMVNYHYIEGYMNSVDTFMKKESGIYSWADKVFPDKPTGVGEFITHYGRNGARNQWWMGTWIRGMRYTNFADIRPYRHDWAILRSDYTPQIENLKKSQSPVAVFDIEYDNLGLDPLIDRIYPTLISSDTVVRRLVIYNDEFYDEEITVEVLLKSSEFHETVYNYNGDRAFNQEIVAQGKKTYKIPLGTHADITCTFMVPEPNPGRADYIDFELIARKKGKVKFRETYHFQLRRSGSSNAANSNSKNIILSELMKPRY